MAKTGPIGFNLATMQGFPEVMARLNAELKLVKERSLGGLIEAAIFLRRQTEDSAPKTPVDIGNLRASWFAVTAKGKVNDPTGMSGHFKSNKETGVKAGEMKADWQALVGEAKGMTGGPNPVVITGFSANYAAPVHEMIGADFTGAKQRVKKGKKPRLRREGAGPKYLQTHVERNVKKIVQIVADNARIK